MKSIQQKIVAACVSVLVLIGGSGTASYWATQKLGHSTVDLNRITRVLHGHMEADMMHDAIRGDVMAAVLAAHNIGDISLAETQQSLEHHIQVFHESVKQNSALVEDPETKAALTALNGPLESYAKSASDLLAIAKSDSEGAEAMLAGFDESFKKLETVMEDAGMVIEASSERVHANGEILADRIQYLMIGVLALGVVFAIGLLVLGVAIITRPILKMSEEMTSIAGGDVDLACSGLGRDDEIGTMASAVELFRQGEIEKLRLEKEAEEARARAEADRIALQQKAEADAAERLRVATAGLAAGLKRLASGDLGVRLEEAFAPDFEALRHDFNQSVDQLSSTMVEILQSVASIDGSAQEITNDVTDLSRRTEQQAASLEETASALEEITVNITNSSERTDDAQKAADQANRSASESAGVVGQADEAMQRIEESSKEISNIIVVIDEIAFQTNLLALNAGVEAARAGEAGKGFAVVAQEVRELAQRSATAAREIKELIESSTNEVGNGVDLVRRTGDALKLIREQISGIDENMVTISHAAREQSTGIREINMAINHMDQTTQQNAAMVEEANAATAGLASEASKLRELVSRFKLAGQSNAAGSSRMAA